MKLRAAILLAFAFGVLTTAAIACAAAPAASPTVGPPSPSPAATSGGSTPVSSVDPTPTPTPTKPPQPRMVAAPAPIESVEISVAESFPPQYFAAVRSGLPNGCVRFDRFEVKRDGDTITITVTNLVPADPNVACTMIYGTVEHNIPLGSDFAPGKTYTVKVNDVTRTFTAQGEAHATPTPVQTVRASLGKEFQVKLNQPAFVEPENLEIVFVEVLEDSRCPANVVCIWAGRARILVRVTKGGDDLGERDLVLEGAREDLTFAEFGGYVVQLRALEPDPRIIGQTSTKETDYIATLSVIKAAAGG